MRFLSLPLALALLLPLGPASVSAEGVVDTHVHYNRESWSVYAPEEALILMQQAGITRALVSSTPDDGTLRLYELAPAFVVPVLRPYRTASDFATWTTDLEIVAHIEERLSWAIPYQGIGEFELAPGQAEHMVVRRLTEIAAERGLFLHAHSDAVAIRELASVRSDVRILWAHAGVDASPPEIAGVLIEHPNVWVELSLRSSDVAPNGQLDPAWRQLFLEYSDRIMLGSDTWLPRDWTVLSATHAALQMWLQQLPPEVAARLAHLTAEALLGSR